MAPIIEQALDRIYALNPDPNANVDWFRCDDALCSDEIHGIETVADTYQKLFGFDDGVYDELIELIPNDEYDDSLDGDFDSAMASAGFGTDEDYGHFGEDN